MCMYGWEYARSRTGFARHKWLSIWVCVCMFGKILFVQIVTKIFTCVNRMLCGVLYKIPIPFGRQHQLSGCRATGTVAAAAGMQHFNFIASAPVFGWRHKKTLTLSLSTTTLWVHPQFAQIHTATKRVSHAEHGTAAQRRFQRSGRYFYFASSPMRVANKLATHSLSWCHHWPEPPAGHIHVWHTHTHTHSSPGFGRARCVCVYKLAQPHPYIQVHLCSFAEQTQTFYALGVRAHSAATAPRCLIRTKNILYKQK